MEHRDGHDDVLIFSAENDAVRQNVEESWKVLIVDDDPEVHNITRMVLQDIVFEGRGLDFFSAYSGAEAEKMMHEHPDTAVIFLDVVMEHDDAGLKFVKYVREELKNNIVRIILRTGQPGHAPEKDVITHYDINDYKAKTELTSDRLFTATISAIRSYRDILTIEQNRRGLEEIIDSSVDLFEERSLSRFAQGVLTQLTSILRIEGNSIYLHSGSFAATSERDGFHILAGTGEYLEHVSDRVEDVVDQTVYGDLMLAAAKRKSIFNPDSYIGYFECKNGSRNILYLKKDYNTLSELDRSLIKVFASNVSVAFDNIYLHQEIVDTQKEVIFTLGEVVETRSKETANHVRRVAEISYILACSIGLEGEDAELLRQASPMHDVGKIGVPDAVLNKPGKLTDEEFEIVKGHTSIGYAILKSSEREIMQTAAIVAHEHHEKWDGSGYPRGLAGEDIHIFGRITAIADVFDALLHERCYKKAWALDDVLALFREQRGKHFDPVLVDRFFEVLDEIKKIQDTFPD